MVTRKQKWQIGVLAVLGCASLCYGGYRWWLTTPPPMPQTMEQAVAVFQDPRFANLSKQRQADYRRQSRQLYEELDTEAKKQWRDVIRDDPEAREAVRDAMREQMLDKAREFAVADEAERTKVLDQTINVMIAAETAAKFRSPRKEAKPEELTDEQRARRDERREAGRKRIQTLIENGDPQRQAYVGEFFKALQRRRIERGLKPMPDFQR